MALTFNTSIAAYAVGRRANMEEWNSFTKNAEAAIGFGVPVMPGSGVNSCVVIDDTDGRNVLGITEASLVLPHTGDAYAANDSVSVCESGVIGVLLNDAVAAGAQARWDTEAGAWTDGAQSTTVVTIPGAQFDEAGAGGAVGIIRYRRPVPSVSVVSGS